MTLRTRLLVALLAIAVVPTLLLALLLADQLGRSTERWWQPAVDHALEDGVETSRSALTRIESNVLARADEWAVSLGPLPLDAARRSALRTDLRRAGLDFALLYRPRPGGWTLAERVVPEGVLAADDLDFAAELPAALQGSHLLRSSRGALAGVARSPDGQVVVTGIRLTPDFFAAVDRVSKARELYRRIGLLVDVQRGWWWVLVVALVLGFAAVATVVARALASQLTRPVAALSTAFEHVARGDLESRVEPSGAAELASLARSFNAMTQSLADARGALQKAEREAAWREVARHLAHEIKNPLTPMRLSLHRLQKRMDGVPEQDRNVVRDSLGAMMAEIDHLTRLAEQFSQYARLPEPRYEPCDLSALAREVAALHEPEGRRLDVSADRAVTVRVDRLLLSRALHNLLLNACEASPEGSVVELATGADAAEAWVEVLDRGPGLPPGPTERLFDPYVSTKNRGSGLGLPLVRDIALQHGGRVTLENRDGGGARARLTLPRSAEEGNAAR